jgi:FAD:protein FMN transferase
MCQRPLFFNCLPVLLLIGNTAFSQRKYSFTQPKMGSPFTITIFAGDSVAAAGAAADAFRLADSLNSILSDYIDSSEINRLSASSGRG